MNSYIYHLNKFYLSEPLRFDSIYLLQTGRMFCTDKTVIEPHIHTNLYELTVVTDGAAVISTNDVPTRVKKGDIYLSYPGDVHKIESDKDDPLKYDFFAFRLNNDEFEKDFSEIAQNYSSPHTRVFHDPRIRTLIGSVITELDSDDKYSNDLLNSVFKQIMIYVIRGFKSIKPGRDNSNASRNELLCYRLMSYIDTHLYSIKNLEELSSVTGYSYGYLSAIFKKTTGNTLASYYQARRLDAARLLLIENRLSVSEISDLFGYASVYAFSKAFKKHLGLSPKAFQKNNI